MDFQVAVLVLILIALFGIVAALLPAMRGGGRAAATHTQRIDPRIGSGFVLVCESGSLAGRAFQLRRREIRVGRARDNDIQIPDRYVSRYHAILQFTPLGFRVIDQDSANGVWVNGRRVAQQVLINGDTLQIGGVKFRYVGKAITPPPRQEVDGFWEYGQRFRFEDYSLQTIPGGKGGQAKVYKAVPRQGDPVLAVKVFTNPDPYTIQKFHQVVRQLMGLNHPHIVRLLGHGSRPDGSLYLVMEYLPGGSLRDRLARGPLPIRDAMVIAGQVCDALAYAHSRGIIHRDIKPENILFDDSGRVKVIDFSTAHFSGERTITQDGTLIGTPYYISYEQAKGEEVVPASDLYSLGIVLFEMVTGRRPFEGDPSARDNSVSIIEQHIWQPPPDPRHFRKDIPDNIRSAILTALNKNARKRFRNANQFAAAIGYHLPSPATPLEVVLSVFDTGRSVVIRGDSVLGRHVINPMDTMISREHFRIRLDRGNVVIEDLRSRNGTYVNGVRVLSSRVLSDGDVIRVGNTDVRVHIRAS